MSAGDRLVRLRRWIGDRTTTDENRQKAFARGSAVFGAECFLLFVGADVEIWKEVRDVVSATIGLAGTIIGFSLAAKSIMLAMPSTEARDDFTRKGGFRQAAKPVRVATVAAGSWSLLGIVLLAYPFPSSGTIMRLTFAVWLGLFLWSVLCIARLVEVLFVLVNDLTPSGRATSMHEIADAVGSATSSNVLSDEDADALQPNMNVPTERDPTMGTDGRDDLI